MKKKLFSLVSNYKPTIILNQTSVKVDQHQWYFTQNAKIFIQENTLLSVDHTVDVGHFAQAPMYWLL